MTNPSHVVIAGTRRAWSREEKQAILAELDEPGATVSAVARRHGLHSSLLFRWRRARLAESRAGAMPPQPAFVPLALPAPVGPAPETQPRPGVIEIELSGGHRLRAEPGVDGVLLQSVIAALLGR